MAMNLCKNQDPVHLSEKTFAYLNQQSTPNSLVDNSSFNNITVQT